MGLAVSRLDQLVASVGASATRTVRRSTGADETAHLRRARPPGEPLRARLSRDRRPAGRSRRRPPAALWPRAVAAMLGAMRAGAVYVPLDPSSPPARVGLIAGDCGLRHVVISPALLAAVDRRRAPRARGTLLPARSRRRPHRRSPGARGPRVGGARRPRPVQARTAPRWSGRPRLHPLHLRLDGRAQGRDALAPERARVRRLDRGAGRALRAADRVASVAPFHFDLSVFDLWASLSHGATVVIVDETTVVSGRACWTGSATQGDHRLVLRALRARAHARERRPRPSAGAPTLRVVLFAGEVFPIKHLRRAMAAPSRRPASSTCTAPPRPTSAPPMRCPGAPPEDATAIPIGKASCGDDGLGPRRRAGKPVADGEVGELFVEGPTVMLGYWDGGRRTPARHPYPTGDLGLAACRRRAHVPRAPRPPASRSTASAWSSGEVEAALDAHPGVREAVVVRRRAAARGRGGSRATRTSRCWT